MYWYGTCIKITWVVLAVVLARLPSSAADVKVTVTVPSIRFQSPQIVFPIAESVIVKNPLVTIIIPASQCEAQLPRCLKAALEQDYDNLQIWAVDNFSTDHTYDVLMDLEKHYRNRLFVARLYSRFNGYGLNQRILGMTNPRSLYLQVLQPSQLLEPGCVSQSLAVLESEVAVKYVTAHVDTLASDGTVRVSPSAFPEDCVIPGAERMLDLLLDRGPRLFASLYRSEMYGRGYGEAYVFDAYLEMFHQFIAASMGEVGYLRRTQCLVRESPAEVLPDPAQSMKVLVERYVLIQAFCTIARRIGKDEVAGQLPQAVQRLGAQCRALAARFLGAGDPEAAQRCEFLGMAFGGGEPLAPEEEPENAPARGRA